MDTAPVPAAAPAPVSAPAPAPVTAPASTAAPVEVKSDAVVEKEKALDPPAVEVKAEESKLALAVVETQKTPADTVEKKSSKGSIDRDVALAELEKEKRLSYIKAWEESEKTKAENKAEKKVSNVHAWENRKKASLEAKLKKYEEELEKKKAAYAETMKNKIALVHKEAEEKRAMVDAIRGEELLKAEEMAAKYRATGQTPKKLLGCF